MANGNVLTCERKENTENNLIRESMAIFIFSNPNQERKILRISALYLCNVSSCVTNFNPKKSKMISQESIRTRISVKTETPLKMMSFWNDRIIPQCSSVHLNNST